MTEALRRWLAGSAEFPDVTAMLPLRQTNARSPSKQAQDGYVYLLRSGPFYKIGKSDELERRIKEIRVALPDATCLEHSIRTDDPSGIEAYWHRRFAERRANGEWFKLTGADVLAFKRRKFQ